MSSRTRGSAPTRCSLSTTTPICASRLKRQAAPATCSRIWETRLGRQPTDQERQELIRIRDTLNLPKTDPVWILLVALQYFRSLYKAIPGEIRKASAAATTAFQIQAESRAEDALARQEAAAVQRMEQIVVENSLKVADNDTEVQRLSAWKWGTLATGFVLLAIMASLWWVKERAYEDGRQAGVNAGIDQARDEVAAANWANTKEGRMARRLADRGSLRLMAQCDAPGWRIQRDHASGTVCFPWLCPD